MRDKVTARNDIETLGKKEIDSLPMIPQNGIADKNAEGISQKVNCKSPKKKKFDIDELLDTITRWIDFF